MKKKLSKPSLRQAAVVATAALGLTLSACGDDTCDNCALTDGGSQVDGGSLVDSGTPADGGNGTDAGSQDAGSTDAGTNSFQVVLLHTNDLHSHLQGHSPEADYTPLVTTDADGTRGGFSRIAAEVAAQRTAAGGTKSVLLVDAGDFTMGTLFEFLVTTQAPELSEMTRLGYDAITLGNHEFDFTTAGIAGDIHASVLAGLQPQLVATNLRFSASSGDDQLEALSTAGLLPRKLVKTLPNGLKVGFIGIMGKNAADVEPLAAPVTFEGATVAGDAGIYDAVAHPDAIAAAVQPVIDDLRNNDHVDLVVALSHSGTDATGAGEDADLAHNTRGLDIIVSGHTHVELEAIALKNRDQKDVWVASTGAYGVNLGKMEFTYTRASAGVDAGVTAMNHALIPIDDSIQGDPATQTRIDGYISTINAELETGGLSYKGTPPVDGGTLADGGAEDPLGTPYAHTAFDLPNPQFQETALGDLVTDSYMAAVSQIYSQTGHPLPDVAIEVAGNIRSDVKAGKTGDLWLADLFRVVPLGIGPDQTPGYPLVNIYLTGADLFKGFEVGLAAQDVFKNNDFFVQMSGAKEAYTAGNQPFTRVNHSSVRVGVTAANPAGNTVDPTACYSVVTTYYVASLFGLVAQNTGGLLTITAYQGPVNGQEFPDGGSTPAQAGCTVPYTAATLPSAIIDRDPLTPGVQELKQWQAFTGYVHGLSGAYGSLPAAAYGTTSTRTRIVAQ